MDDKLPDGVALAMEQVVVGDSNPCKNCYFLGKKCPKDWTAHLGRKPSCINGRDIIFREIGESDEQ